MSASGEVGKIDVKLVLMITTFVFPEIKFEKGLAKISSNTHKPVCPSNANGWI